MNDLLRIAHDVEDRLDRRETGRVAANHDRQRAVDGADVTAADRGIEHRSTAFLRLRRKLPCGCGRDAAHVDDDCAWLHRLEHAVLAVEHELHIRRIRHHRDDPGGLAGHVGRRSRRACAGRHEIVNRAAAAAVDHNRVAGFQEVLCHRPAHEAQTDESDRFHGGQYSQAPCTLFWSS